MNAFTQPHAELSSWKEIAAYLEVSVKTAQRWERDRGLPVRRMPWGGGRVWAEVLQLDAWKRSHPLEEPGTALAQTNPAAGRLRWRPVLIGLALVPVLALGITAFRSHVALPFGVAVDVQGFVATNEEGRELWRYNAPGPLELSRYRSDEQRGLSWVGDLDGDGTPEVLFSPQFPGPVEDTVLLCFDSRGQVRWRFKPGKTVHARDGTPFAPPYGVSSVLVLPPGQNGQRRILVAAIHHLYHPTQVSLLDHQGRLQREYWHSGHLHRTKLHSMQGRQVVLMAGVRNANGEATLVVLDPETFGGASEEPAEYQLAGMGASAGIERLLFRRSCINRAFEAMNVANGIIPATDGITVAVQERHNQEAPASILYHFSNNLDFRNVLPSSQFTSQHARLAGNGTLNHKLTSGEMQSLRPIRIE